MPCWMEDLLGLVGVVCPLEEPRGDELRTCQAGPEHTCMQTSCPHGTWEVNQPVTVEKPGPT